MQRGWRVGLLVNTVLLAAAALYFCVAPAAILARRLADPALRHPGVPAFTWGLHRALAPRLQQWAEARVASGVAGHLNRHVVPDTEWPIFTCVFYLMATENLQAEWVKTRPADDPGAPAVYARPALDAAVRLVTDPVHHTWVREHWGPDYLHRENVFFRSLLIAALARYERLTGERRHHALLVDQAGSLADELDRSPAGILDDYPQECYPIDVLAAVAWIRDSDDVTGLDHRAFVERAHRAFLPPLTDHGLPIYRLDQHSFAVLDGSRGTGNSWVLLFAPRLWPEDAQRWCETYVRHFWQARWLCRGFREYASDAGEPDFGFDVDAGPIIAGFSPAANAFAVAGLRAMGRFDLAWPISAEVLVSTWPLPHGRLAAASWLSSSQHAPYLGEAALLSQFTTPPAPGVRLRVGQGAPPPIVWVGFLLYLGGAALLLFAARQRWRRNCTAAWEQMPGLRAQMVVWWALLVAALMALAAGATWLAFLAVALAQLLPRLTARRCLPRPIVQAPAINNRMD